jgi:hypothetical protein
MPAKYAPRLSVEIDEEDSLYLRNNLPQGFQRTIFNLIVKDLIEAMKKLGPNKVLGAFMNKDIDLSTLCHLKVKNENQSTESVPGGDVRG